MKKESPVFLFLSALLSNFIDQVFSILPSKTRIGDRASRGHVVADVLASFEQVALDHDTFDKFVKFRIKEEKINEAFEAAAEAVEEAILNSMVTAKEKRGLDGARYRSLAEFLEIPGFLK